MNTDHCHRYYPSMIVGMWQVALYDFQGNMLQQLDFSSAPDAHDFTCAAFNPSGDVALLGGYNSISSCNYNTQACAWELTEAKQVCCCFM